MYRFLGHPVDFQKKPKTTIFESCLTSFLQNFPIDNSLKIIGQPGGKSRMITGKSQM